MDTNSRPQSRDRGDRLVLRAVVESDAVYSVKRGRGVSERPHPEIKILTYAQPANAANRHRWGPVEKLTLETPHGHRIDQTERTCLTCGLVKITVHPPHGYAWREWRMPGQVQVQVDGTPPCRMPATTKP
jgi:hypothetical protein